MLEFAGRFSNPDLLIKQGKFWSIVFREGTTTLGNVVIILNRECPSMAEVLPEEMAEFAELSAWYENKVKKLYGAVKFNYACFMMVENFVHFHVIPRYDKPVDAYGFTFVDSDWPKRSNFGKLDVPAEVKEQIKNALKND